MSRRDRWQWCSLPFVTCKKKKKKVLLHSTVLGGLLAVIAPLKKQLHAVLMNSTRGDSLYHQYNMLQTVLNSVLIEFLSPHTHRWSHINSLCFVVNGHKILKRITGNDVAHDDDECFALHPPLEVFLFKMQKFSAKVKYYFRMRAGNEEPSVGF